MEQKTALIIGGATACALGIGVLAYWLTTRPIQGSQIIIDNPPVVPQPPDVPPTPVGPFEKCTTMIGTKCTVGENLTEQQTCLANGYYWYDYGDGKGARCWYNPDDCIK